MRSKNVQGRRPRAGNGGQAVWNVRFAAGHALDQGGTAEALSDESFSAELAVPAFVAADCRSPQGTCRCPMRLIADDLRSAFPWSSSLGRASASRVPRWWMASPAIGGHSAGQPTHRLAGASASSGYTQAARSGGIPHRWGNTARMADNRPQPTRGGGGAWGVANGG
jgi:hypothetical protein